MSPSINESAERDVYLNLLRAQELLISEFEELFRANGLTHTQFNVLRILVTSSEKALPCQVIGENLLNRVPDVTRLIDRMEKAGLVTRKRSAEDRRVVLVQITSRGKRACESLYGDVDKLHRKQLSHLSASKLKSLDAGLRAVLARS